MRLIKSAGVALFAVLALGAFASVAASAAVPEFGRCVPATTPKTGEYAGAHCTKPAGGKGNYNFIAGPGAKPKFEGTSSEGPILEMPNLKISCSAETYNGEYTGAKTASVTVDLIGCINAANHKKCQTNLAKEGEIEPPGALEGEIGFVNINGRQNVGIDLKRSPLIAAFTCGETTQPPELTGTIEGSVIGQLSPLNVMREESRLRYRTAGGKQIPEAFEGGSNDTLTVKLLSGLTTTTEAAALKVKLIEVLNEEPIEIKAK
jgi:hypothetical protein